MYNSLLYLDTSAYLWVKNLQRRQLLAFINKLVSKSGDGPLYGGLLLMVWFLQPIAHAEFINVALLAYMIELPCFVFLKSFVKRDRPFVSIPNCDKLVQPSDKFSMPSGHTAAAFVMAGAISNFYSEYSSLAFTWAILIGNARVATGVHYPGDVLVGAALGSSAVFLAISILAL